MTTGPPTPASRFQPGQRWISVAEPELGLGQVHVATPRRVTLWFPATRETRQYANTDDAPIRRAAFRVGDRVSTPGRGDATVLAVTERAGLLYYECGDGDVCETALSDTLSFSSPSTRLYAGHFDPSSLFDLRAEALMHLFNRRKSKVRGLVGGRIDLLPHQLGIAAEVSDRLIPRVLLADEVGLGKTIEACLIVHRLLLTGRAQRVLVVVPETLVHQWFLELLRRFNLWIHIFTEARCVAIEEDEPGTNPFLDDQLLLCDIRLFVENPDRLDQAVAAGWDLVVVDEAHHLGWSAGAPSDEYAAVERLGRVSPGLLLLTGTPEQLGVSGHFARLRLLDPDRFHDLEEFKSEATHYRTIARLAQRLRAGSGIAADERAQLARVLGKADQEIAARLADEGQAACNEWIERLLDQHGTGRVMFRNTRATIAGFPARIAHLHDLGPANRAQARVLAEEWASDSGGQGGVESRVSYAHDLRIDWLLALLQSIGDQKALLICRSERKALAIESALKHRTTMPVGAFHEGLTLVQRDRAAAWFADPHGARLLICSEIGSEGRNFQFAHHLLLFDLPLDPGLLEQRLGRLDRIGQREDIHVHVPVVRDSHLAVLARWYHDGLEALEHQLPGGRELLERFEYELRDLASLAYTDRRTVGAALDTFIGRVRTARDGVARRLEEGRDRLLEWNSLRPALSAGVIDDIRRQDADRALDEFMLAAFDLFFVEVEELAPRTYRLGSAGVLVDDFPGLKAEGLAYTRDRERALLREDLQFLTWDHPLATGALDMLLGSEKGNCGFARWTDAARSALYLEAIYVLECLAPPDLHADRFLPPTPVRVAVDHRGSDASDIVAAAALSADAKPAAGRGLVARDDIRDALLPRLLDRTRELAEARLPPLVEQARQAMQATLAHETTRLRDLQKVNPSVRDEEIEMLVRQQQNLDASLRAARIRLDAVRLIHRGPALQRPQPGHD